MGFASEIGISDNTVRSIGSGPDRSAGPHAPRSTTESIGRYRMAMIDELRRLALFTSGVAELSRDRAEKLVRKAVKSGDIRSGQAKEMVKGLMETSRQNRKELLALIRSEMQNQIANLGVASKRDFERLERRVGRLEERARGPKKTTAKKTTGPKKTTAKKTTAKKATKVVARPPVDDSLNTTPGTS